MKNVLPLLVVSLLLSSCIVIKVYEAPKAPNDAPKMIKKHVKMIPSDLKVPFPQAGTEILFFGEGEAHPQFLFKGTDSLKIKHDDQHMGMAIFTEDDSLHSPDGEKEVVVFKIDAKGTQAKKQFQWKSKEGDDTVVLMMKDTLSFDLPEAAQKVLDSVLASKKGKSAVKKRIRIKMNAPEETTEENTFTFKTSDKHPIIIINGEEKAPGFSMDEIHPDDIATINVLKGPAAVKQVGEKGVNGVIMIQMKKK